MWKCGKIRQSQDVVTHLPQSLAPCHSFLTSKPFRGVKVKSPIKSGYCPGGGGHFRNFWVGVCRGDPGTLDLYPRVNCLKTIPFTAAHTHVYGSTPPPPRGYCHTSLLILYFSSTLLRGVEVWKSPTKCGYCHTFPIMIWRPAVCSRNVAINIIVTIVWQTIILNPYYTLTMMINIFHDSIWIVTKVSNLPLNINRTTKFHSLFFNIL